MSEKSTWLHALMKSLFVCAVCREAVRQETDWIVWNDDDGKSFYALHSGTCLDSFCVEHVIGQKVRMSIKRLSTFRQEIVQKETAMAK